MNECDSCRGAGGHWDTEVQDQWYWCENCDAADKHFEKARKAREPKRWEELPREKQKSAYWAAIPDDERTILDAGNYEIVYVYFDGNWCVYRMGQSERETLNGFRFLFTVNTPGI
jgi:hypothetical protein